MITASARPIIFGTGLVALDLVVGPDPSGPVQVSAGGTCGNVLAALAYLGWGSYPIARMNGDAASAMLRMDLARWDVRLDFVSCGRTADTPMVIQRLRHDRRGNPRHRFSWECPQCGSSLPPFKPVTREAIDVVGPALAKAQVFLLDRLSRASLEMAEVASRNGALVVFEPSARSDPKFLVEALKVAHVVKYAAERLDRLDGVMSNASAPVVEIQTLGEAGLRYRHRLGRSRMTWLHLDALPAPILVDTCGAGDWCTAGLIARLGQSGQEGFRVAGPRGLRAALRYGQALAAWNCGFEGARGGMYVSSREVVEEQVAALLARRRATIEVTAEPVRQDTLVACPLCPSLD